MGVTGRNLAEIRSNSTAGDRFSPILSIFIRRYSWHKHGMTNDDATIQAIRDRLNKPIVLVGMPASGKTSTGRLLTRVLGFHFIDADCEIEEQTGQKIPVLFEAHGEAGFRDLESRIIRSVFARQSGPFVFSTGGGAVIREENAALIFGETCSIWLQASVGALLERTAAETHRPLLRNPDPAKTLRDLEAARYSLYRKAEIAIDTNGRLPEQIILEIITKIGERL